MRPGEPGGRDSPRSAPHSSCSLTTITCFTPRLLVVTPQSLAAPTAAPMVRECEDNSPKVAGRFQRARHRWKELGLSHSDTHRRLCRGYPMNTDVPQCQSLEVTERRVHAVFFRQGSNMMRGPGLMHHVRVEPTPPRAVVTATFVNWGEIRSRGGGRMTRPFFREWSRLNLTRART